MGSVLDLNHHKQNVFYIVIKNVCERQKTKSSAEIFQCEVPVAVAKAGNSLLATSAAKSNKGPLHGHPSGRAILPAEDVMCKRS